MMPKMDGLEVCRAIREKMQTPIIMLTARAEEVDKVLGLELGADDYVTKPFSFRELMARIKANIRRTGQEEPAAVDTDMQTYGDLVIDFKKVEIRKRGAVIDLTFREFELVKFLSARKGQVFSREELMEKVWGYDYYGDLRAVDVAMRRLREKLEDDPANPRYIMTKRGAGYYLQR